ncbi:MAG: hypothetical protein VX593_08375 [Pseudomonadota bacterium]|nr:hypothetical protein [Pseudomonadota bacterium]
MKLNALFVLPILLLGAACTTQHAGDAANRAVADTRSGAKQAAMTPLRDLNLQREPIPVVLQDIKNPYDIPEDISCEQIESQVAALNSVLGPDWDALPRNEADPTLSDYAADEASEEMLDIIADEAGAIIPYRSWVRRLSGAKAHQKKVKRAEQRGGHRRTYLKALGLMKGCEGMAAPRRETDGDGVSEPALPPVDFVSTTPPQYRTASGPTEIAALTPEENEALEEEFDWPEEWSADQWEDDAPEAEEVSPASDGTSWRPIYD